MFLYDHINSDKIKNELGFNPSHSISDAINSLFDAFDNNCVPNSFDDDIYFNVIGFDFNSVPSFTMYKHSFCYMIIKKQFEFLNKLIKQKSN